MKLAFFFEINGMLEIRFQPGIYGQRRTQVPVSKKSIKPRVGAARRQARP
jgi:hypothetical protein